MSRVSAAKWQERYDALAATVVDVSLTPEVAERIGRKLYRYAKRSTFRGSVVQTSGNRSSSVHGFVMTLNAAGGLRSLIHDFAWSLAPSNDKRTFLKTKIKLTKEAIRRDWFHNPAKLAPKPKAPKVETRVMRLDARLDRLKARLDRWTQRRDRADRAMKRIARRIKAAERTRVHAQTADALDPVRSS